MSGSRKVTDSGGGFSVFLLLPRLLVGLNEVHLQRPLPEVLQQIHSTELAAGLLQQRGGGRKEDEGSRGTPRYGRALPQVSDITQTIVGTM